MDIFRKIAFRTYQKTLYLASFLMKFKEPTILSYQDSSFDAHRVIKRTNFRKPLIIIDSNLYSLNLHKRVIEGLEKNGIEYVVFHDVEPNPTNKMVLDAVEVYKQNNCDSIIGFGGGSSMDTAKIVGACIANPKKDIKKLKGILKVKHRFPMLVAIPTTAGTGSEATVAAVIINEENRDKYAISDPKLIPNYALLDPNLLINLPWNISATTGMDAFTHAVESYIGHSNTRKTKKSALEAIKLIKENLLLSCQNPSNIDYRRNMLEASYKAGIAFTRAYVGPVHAMAHSLGGRYNVAHGYANSIILPIVLRAYGKRVYKKLAEIYDYLEFLNSNSKKEKAEFIINWIEQLNKDLKIESEFHQIIKENDILPMAVHSLKESHLYPSPKLFDLKEYISLFEKLYNLKN